MRVRSSKVADYCVRDVVTVDRQATAVTCARRMHDTHVGSLVVVEERAGARVPVGMITDRDIAIEVVAFGLDPEGTVAGDIMPAELALAREDDDLFEVLATMRAYGVRRLPVVDAAGALTGIVSADDLWEVLADELDGLVRVMKAEQSRERATRTAGESKME